MSMFTPAEIRYLQSQRRARIATAGLDDQPHVVPVAFRYNAETDTIDVGGHGFVGRKKYRDVQRNPRVAIVVDELASTNPWRPRGTEVRGEAVIVATGGEVSGSGFGPQLIRVRPRRIASWGFNDPTAMLAGARSV